MLSRHFKRLVSEGRIINVGLIDHKRRDFGLRGDNKYGSTSVNSTASLRIGIAVSCSAKCELAGGNGSRLIRSHEVIDDIRFAFTHRFAARYAGIFR